jgi:dihydroorotate dehydrogenase electron transfer subunit
LGGQPRFTAWPMSPISTLRTPARSGLFTTEVVACKAVCDEHFRLTLRALGFPDAAPGQFVQVRCGGLDVLAGPALQDGSAGADEQCFGGQRVAVHGRGRPFTRRPFSIGGLRRQGTTCEIDLVYRVIGPGTAWMAGLRPAQRVSVIGPLGRPFSIVGDVKVSILVGGGIGLPPIMWLGQRMGQEGRKAVAVCGARCRSLLPLTVEAGTQATASSAAPPAWTAREFGTVPVIVTTDDGSFGLKGTVIDGLKAALGQAGTGAKDAVIYACGPEKMLRAVASLAASKEIACQVCMERMMACGMGTCQSCVIRIRDAASPSGWRYRLCCSDGPVFDARDIVW